MNVAVGSADVAGVEAAELCGVGEDEPMTTTELAGTELSCATVGGGTWSCG